METLKLLPFMRVALIAAAVLLPLLVGLVLASGDFAVDAMVVLVVAIAAAGLVAIIGLQIAVRRSPVNRVARLIKAGRHEEACDLGLRLLEKKPGHALLRLNTVAVHVALGRRDKARELFEPLRREQIPEPVRGMFDSLQEKIS